MKKLLLCLFALSILPLFANPITPQKRYRADFEIKAIHPAKPFDWFCQNIKFEYPGISFRFANAKGKTIRTNSKTPFYMAFSNDFVPGSFEFYAPDGSAKLLLFKSGVVVRNLKVTEIPVGDDLALPVNPCITGPVRNAVITVNPDKTTVFDVSANGVVESLPIAVEGGQRYRLTIRGIAGTRLGKKSSLLCRYYFYKSTSDRKALSSNKESLRTGSLKKPLVYEILAPKEAKWFTIWCMWGKFVSYKLEKI